MHFRERKRIRTEVMARGLPDPSLAFNNQRGGAKKRGIGWELSFEQWWEIWRDYYHLRGCGTNGLVMARENDTGPYAVGNVHLTTNLGNAQEYHRSAAARKDVETARLKAYAAKKHAAWGRKDYPSTRLPDLIKAQDNENQQESS